MIIIALINLFTHGHLQSQLGSTSLPSKRSYICFCIFIPISFLHATGLIRRKQTLDTDDYLFLVWHIALTITLKNGNRTEVIKNATTANFDKAREVDRGYIA